MLRQVYKVRTLMLLVALVAITLAIKSHFIDRPAALRRAEYYRTSADWHARGARTTKFFRGKNADASSLEEIRQQELLAKHFLDAARSPNSPNNVYNEQNIFLRRQAEAMKRRAEEMKRRAEAMMRQALENKAELDRVKSPQ